MIKIDTWYTGKHLKTERQRMAFIPLLTQCLWIKRDTVCICVWERERVRPRERERNYLLSICVWRLPFSICWACGRSGFICQLHRCCQGPLYYISKLSAVSHINTCTHKCQAQLHYCQLHQWPRWPTWGLPKVPVCVRLHCMKIENTGEGQAHRCFTKSIAFISLEVTKMTGWHVFICHTELLNPRLIFTVVFSM